MSAPRTAADYLLQRLREWEVDKVFGYPGEGLAGLLDAWQRVGDHPAFIQARHGEMCAFEAVGYAKLSGRIGVCAAASGAGAVHLLNGLYDAKLDRVPILAVIGRAGRGAVGDGYQQEADLPSLFKDVAGDFAQVVTAPDQLPGMLDRAIRVALAERAPAVLIVPAEVQHLPHVPPAHAAAITPRDTGVDWSSVLPGNPAIVRAAEVLNAGRRVAVLAGSAARGAHDEVQYVADLLGAGVAKPLLGKDVLSDDLPYVTGTVGLLGTRPSDELMAGCDTLLIIGSSLPCARFLPEPGQARAVQIDIDPKYIGADYPNDVNLVGDAAATLRALIPHLRRKEGRAWREDIEAKVTRWWQVLDAEAMAEADPVNPLRVFAELSTRLPDDAVVTADSGSSAAWYACHLRLRGDMRGSLSGSAATVGSGVPYGIGAKFAFPGRPVVVFAGDGAMQMSGLAELITVKRYWPQWADPRLIFAVLHSGSLDQADRCPREPGGAPRFAESQTVPDVDYAAFAAGLGLHAITVDRPDQLGPAWESALSADRPTLLDVHTDPSVAPQRSHTDRNRAGVGPLDPSGGPGQWAGPVRQEAKPLIQHLLPRQAKPSDT
jgi:pyruvate dehydrogenase (quinone)